MWRGQTTRRFSLRSSAATGLLALLGALALFDAQADVRADASPAEAQEYVRIRELPGGRAFVFRALLIGSPEEAAVTMDALFAGGTAEPLAFSGARAAYRTTQAWEAKVPIEMRYSSYGSPAGLDAQAGSAIVDWAMGQWNAIGSGIRLVQGDAISPLENVCEHSGEADGVNSIEWRTNQRANVLGTTCSLTTRDVVHGEIQVVETDIVFNADILWSFGTEVTAGRYDWRSNLLHELGHVLGLGHTDEPGGVMLASLSSGVQRRTPAADDIAGVRRIYGPGPAPEAAPKQTPSIPPGLTRRAVGISVSRAR